jgi:hypothetical protein
MPDPSDDAQAIRAHNVQLDDDWETTCGIVAPEDVTWPRGVYSVQSVAHALLPSALVQEVLDAHPEVKPTKDGLWLFLPESAPETDNLVLRVTVRSKAYFDLYRKERDLTPDRIATPDPLVVRPSSTHWRQYARMYGFNWPCLLTAWSDGQWVYVRRTFTEEVWAALDPKLRRYILAHRRLFGLP